MIDKEHKNNSYRKKHSQPAVKTLQVTSPYNHVIENYRERCRYVFIKLQSLSKHTRNIWSVAEVTPFVKIIRTPRYSDTIQQIRNLVNII
jgi:hypothetical protein